MGVRSAVRERSPDLDRQNERAEKGKRRGEEKGREKSSKTNRKLTRKKETKRGTYWSPRLILREKKGGKRAASTRRRVPPQISVIKKVWIWHAVGGQPNKRDYREK